MNLSFSRRSFTKGLVSSSALGACSLHPVLGPLGRAHATASGRAKTLVMVNLFGGIDGLNWVVPHTNSTYYARRPNLALYRDPATSLLDLDEDAALNPAWQMLWQPFWNDTSSTLYNKMAVVQKVGYPNPTRSHFESREVWSSGFVEIDPSDRRGWIARLADREGFNPTTVFGVGSDTNLRELTDFSPLTLSARPTMVGTLASFKRELPSWHPDHDLLAQAVVEQAASGEVHAGLSEVVASTIRNVDSSIDLVRQIDQDYVSSVMYPNTRSGSRLKETAKIIQAQRRGDVDTRILYTSVSGFDTHDSQAFNLNRVLVESGDALLSFVQDLQAMGAWEDTCVMVFSEFGRTCKENGSGGTDHGWAAPTVLLGGGVQGGVYGEAPTEDDLTRQAVPYSIDFRSILRPVIRDHLGFDADAVLARPSDSPFANEQPTSVDLPLFG